MHEASTAEGLADVIQRFFSHALAGTVAIDGSDGVGKTTLATDLQAIIGGTVVSLDDFVVENQGGYVPYLKTKELSGELANGRRPLIVEGICVLAALERVVVQSNVLVYVKRVDEEGYWYDEETCDPSEPVDELIARLAQEVAALDRFHREQSGEPPLEEDAPKLTPLREEIIRYHATYRPSSRAAIIFMRRQDG